MSGHGSPPWDALPRGECEQFIPDLPATHCRSASLLRQTALQGGSSFTTCAQDDAVPSSTGHLVGHPQRGSRWPGWRAARRRATIAIARSVPRPVARVPATTETAMRVRKLRIGIAAGLVAMCGAGLAVAAPATSSSTATMRSSIAMSCRRSTCPSPARPSARHCGSVASILLIAEFERCHRRRLHFADDGRHDRPVDEIVMGLKPAIGTSIGSPGGYVTAPRLRAAPRARAPHPRRCSARPAPRAKAVLALATRAHSNRVGNRRRDQRARRGERRDDEERNAEDLVDARDELRARAGGHRADVGGPALDRLMQ